MLLPVTARATALPTRPFTGAAGVCFPAVSAVSADARAILPLVPNVHSAQAARKASRYTAIAEYIGQLESWARIWSARGLGLGHSTPIVPPVLAVALAADLVHQWRTSRWWLPLAAPVAVHAAYVPLLPVMPHGAVVTAAQIAPSLALAVGGSVLVVLTTEGLPRNWYRGVQAAALVSALLVMPLLSATTALGHDPGQGTSAGEAHWRALAREHFVEVTLATTNKALTPVKLAARRAGNEVTGHLTQGSAGTYRGSIALHASCRWFLYATFRNARNRTTETWIPVQQGRNRNVDANRPVYLPPAQTHGAGRTTATITLDALSGAILAAAARAGRRRGRKPRVLNAQRG